MSIVEGKGREYPVTFRVVNREGLKALGYEGEETEEEDYYDYTYYLVRLEEGQAPLVIGSDGCEPEDATLTRSFAWVVGALNKTYALGWEDGCQKGQELANADISDSGSSDS